MEIFPGNYGEKAPKTLKFKKSTRPRKMGKFFGGGGGGGS